MDRREQLGTHGRGLLAAGQAVKPSLELAQVLHAGDDFLAGVAALAKAHAVQCLQIDHLRDEQLAGRAKHLADAGAHLRQQPGVESDLRQLGRARLRGEPELDPAILQAQGEAAV